MNGRRKTLGTQDSGPTPFPLHPPLAGHLRAWVVLGPPLGTQAEME